MVTEGLQRRDDGKHTITIGPCTAACLAQMQNTGYQPDTEVYGTCRLLCHERKMSSLLTTLWLGHEFSLEVSENLSRDTQRGDFTKQSCDLEQLLL